MAKNFIFKKEENIAGWNKYLFIIQVYLYKYVFTFINEKKNIHHNIVLGEPIS